jgi:glutaredoxin 3
MAKISMYSTGTCPYCQRAETLLSGVKIEKIRVDRTRRRDEMMQKTGRRTVPQIWRSSRRRLRRPGGPRRVVPDPAAVDDYAASLQLLE